MLGRIAACGTAVALAGCAYITGPCELLAEEVSAEASTRKASCATGGTMVVWPKPDFELRRPLPVAVPVRTP